MQGSLSVPFHTTPGLHQLAKLLFRVFGWKTEGVVAQPARFVIIAAPHTSNWDAVVMVTAAYIFGVKLSWFIKDAAFFFPLGMIVRFFGGIPIDRSRRSSVTGIDRSSESTSSSSKLAASARRSPASTARPPRPVDRRPCAPMRSESPPCRLRWRDRRHSDS